jgi:hypothetical protein
MFEKTSDDLEFEKLLLTQKTKLLNDFEINYKTQQDTLKTILSAKQHAISNKMESNQVFWNAAGFINICSFDLKVIVKEMTFASDEWSKRYFARQTCQLIYELIGDLFKILGNDFKKHIEKLDNNENLKISLKDIRTDLNNFKREYNKRLEVIRNVATAHRDKDFINQFEIIKSIIWMETISMAFKFDKILNELGTVIQKIIDRSSAELDRGN